MLDKCANPACSATFRRLRDGRIFVIEVEIEAQDIASGRQLRYFWLCNSCRSTMTVIVDRDKRVQVLPLSGRAAS